MNLPEAVLYALRNLSQRSLRSWLTILGLVVGVIAIVVILSVTEGFNKDITDQLSAFGPDQMFVYPISDIGSSFSSSAAFLQTSGKLYQRDVDDIENIPGVKAVARSVYGKASMSFKGKEITGFIIGSDRKMFDMYSSYLQVESGRLYKDGERNVVFFGADAATDYFGKDEVEVGNVVQINQKNYRVVGVQKRIGTSMSQQDDSQIYVSFEDGQDLFAGQILKDEVSIIMIQVDEGFDPEEIKHAIELKLANNHRVRPDEKDFTVITAKQIYEIVGTVLLSIQLVLAAVALIASVVGAIGIANTMFMNVLERIREIGILKSVGATQKEILMLFLVESAIIGFAGGLIGLIIGYGILQVLSEFFAIPVLLRLRIIAFVFLFSVGTGVLAGFLPAWRAAKLDPVDALR